MRGLASGSALIALAACGGGDDGGPLNAAPADAAVDAPVDSAIPAVPDITGTAVLGYDLSFSPGPEDPAMQFLVTWTLRGDGTLDARYQPLCITACQTLRAPVGEPIIVTGVQVSAGGSFNHRLVGTLPGEATLLGSAESLDATHAGVIRTDNLVCGSVTGTLSGVNLVGTTFVAIRVTSTVPADWPPPPSACPSS